MKSSALRMMGGVLSLAAAVALIACGGDDEGDSISKEEFVAQASEICTEGDREIDEASGEFFGGGAGQKPTRGQIEDFGTDVVAPGVEEQVEQIRALGAPEGDEEQVEAMLAAAQDGVDRIREEPTDLEQDDPLEEASRVAGEYGVEGCAN